MDPDVLFLAEHFEGKLAPSTLELAAKARELAASSSGAPRGILLGHDAGALADSLTPYASEIVLVDDPALAEYAPGPYEQVLRATMDRTPPRVLLVAHSAVGYDFAPALAGAMDLPLVTNCVDVRLEGSTLVATRRLLNEKVQGEFEIASDRTYVVTLRPGTVKPPEPHPPGRLTRSEVAVDAGAARERFLRIERPQVQDIDIGQADVIVAAGRGIKKKENLALFETLAKRLGGVVGASRPLTDLEWLPKTRQVGQSGKTVRPKLYLACGISGAMQHVAGMKDSGFIVAINTDPSAPIFEVAHVGVQANVLEILPALLKEIGA
ncbi:MAG: hypothetical protein A3K66_06955 [Euryarchaeota archaeon RBG_16_67_27]|nr:MAG: hypothetical protein A3K66_06955 [Euryarchaeota archaeon RBG_16_67_27]